jgi:hypothetical protein
MKIIKRTEITKNGNMAVKSIKTLKKIKVRTLISRAFNVLNAKDMDTMQTTV